MASDPLAVVANGCWFALRLGLRVSPVPTGNLRVEAGVYWLRAGMTYHPLEAALAGMAASGNWQEDVATLLGVDAHWISGFLDGFSQAPESTTAGEYLQGYLTAEQLRTTRYRRDFPDRRCTRPAAIPSDCVAQGIPQPGRPAELRIEKLL